MGNRHFVTVLGTGNYAECVYETEDKQFAYKTPFVQIAVLKHIMSEYRPGDKITVFATQTAEEKNWHSTKVTISDGRDSAKAAQTSDSGKEQPLRKHIYGKKSFRTLPSVRSQNNLEQDNPGSVRENSQDLPEKTFRKGLHALLQEEFPDTEKQIVRIPEGKNGQELNRIFECIYGELSDGEIVFFDFTHGLRNLPMQALAVVNYAKVLKKIQVGGLYYGAYELGKPQADGLRHVQILDMSFCSRVQDWTSAAETFVKAGSSNQIKSLHDQSQENMDEANSEYQDIVDRLFDLTNCLETSRGMIAYGDEIKKLKKKSGESIYAAYRCFQNSYDELNSKELSDIEQPIKRLIEYVYDDVKILDSKLLLKRKGAPNPVAMKYTALGMATVKWAIRKNLIQQGYTALNETLISYICELHGINARRYEDRDCVRQTIRIVNIEYELKNSPPGGIKLFRQANWLNVYKKDKFKHTPIREFEETAFEILSSLPDEVFSLSNYIGDARNSLNHFSHQPADQEIPSYMDLTANLSEGYKQMMKIIENNPNIDTTQYM